MLTVHEITEQWKERSTDRRKSKVAEKSWSDENRRKGPRRTEEIINKELFDLVDGSNFTDELKAAQKAAIRSVG